ncbi:hypothetical protein DM860_013674 [Cuscuta australis]|uniref:PARP catalytic domain-containing protein n=1 Tax=Cuscuta australis TaxID=267555 RepID=A0A328EE62_9ASTE|nr:hypothetical protein DM860_013674 [Cuscuta australis]
MVTSLAILVCHPSSTIRCFKPKSSAISPKRERTPLPPPSPKKNKNPKPQESFDSHAKRVLSFPRFKEIEPLEEVAEVDAIFRAGWKHNVGYRIQKVFRVNCGEAVYKRFEVYRKIVKSKGRESGVRRDGNEVLRYRGTGIACLLGFDRFSTTCRRKSCGVCRTIGGCMNSEAMGRSPVTLSKTSWRAHRRVEKCGHGNMRAAIVVCRVIAGRVARCSNGNIVSGEEEKDDTFDSVEYMDGSEKLMVLDSRAILPCFVVLYEIL